MTEFLNSDVTTPFWYFSVNSNHNPSPNHNPNSLPFNVKGRGEGEGINRKVPTFFKKN